MIFWGDFTTSVDYGKNDYQYVSADRFGSRFQMFARYVSQSTFDRWLKMYLPDDGCRYYSVGQNFQTMNQSEWSRLTDDVRYKYGQFRSIVTRDSVSYANLANCFAGARHRVKLLQGVDAAFFCRNSVQHRVQRPGKKTVGVFFGRSKLQGIDDLYRDLHRKMDVVEISLWFLRGEDFQSSYDRAIELIGQCDVIVSDTYHLLINAMRLGCPAVGVGVVQTQQFGTVGDYKKKVLFKDLGLSKFYIELPNHVLTAQQIEIISTAACLVDGGYWSGYAFDREREINKIAEALAD